MSEDDVRDQVEQAEVVDLDAARAKHGGGSDDADSRSPAFSDEALALEFATRHKDELRYVAKWGRWLLWDGQRWKFEDTLRAFDMAHAVCREVAKTCDKPTLARGIAGAPTVAAVERLAKADRRLAATADQWDRDPWLLATPGSVIDLRTGKDQPHERGDHITMITAVAPGIGCPTWYDFIDRATDGDHELYQSLLTETHLGDSQTV